MTTYDSLRFFKNQERLTSFHESSLESHRTESLSFQHPTSVESHTETKNRQKTTWERSQRTSLARALLALPLWHAGGAQIFNNPSIHHRKSTKRYLTQNNLLLTENSYGSY